MGLAALLIVVFHFYIPFTGGKGELAVYRSAYIGVDLFFFLSGYSMVQNQQSNNQISPSYGAFLRNRLKAVYLPFVLFTLFATVYHQWTIKRFWGIVTGVEFFQRGGGAFLWYLVAILLVYLAAPWMVHCKRRFAWRAFVGLLLGWLALVMLLQYGIGYTTIFILLNRIPVFLLGMYYDELRKLALGRYRLPLIIVGLLAGGWLLYRFGSVVRLTKPLEDGYYLTAIPFVLSLVALWDMISAHSAIQNVPLRWMGRFTLELYALQMIVGFDLERWILKATKQQKLLTFVLTALCLSVLSYWIHLARAVAARYFFTRFIPFIQKENKP